MNCIVGDGVCVEVKFVVDGDDEIGCEGLEGLYVIRRVELVISKIENVVNDDNFYDMVCLFVIVGVLFCSLWCIKVVGRGRMKWLKGVV